MKVHFDAKGMGYYRSGFPECGNKDVVVDKWLPNLLKISNDVTQVTCKSCMKTAAYRYAVEEMELEERVYGPDMPNGG